MECERDRRIKQIAFIDRDFCGILPRTKKQAIKQPKNQKKKTANEVTYVEICVRNLHSRVHCTGIRR